MARGLKVDVYRNLNEGGYSIKSREQPSYGTVIAHRDECFVEDAEFVVQEAGQQKVRDTGRKNVHAFVRGVWAEPRTISGVRVSYNPMENDHFTDHDSGKPLDTAEIVQLGERGVIASGVSYK